MRNQILSVRTKTADLDRLREADVRFGRWFTA